MKEQGSCFLRRLGSVVWDKMKSTEGGGPEKGQSFLQGRWESQKVIDKRIAEEVEEETGKEVKSIVLKLT